MDPAASIVNRSNFPRGLTQNRVQSASTPSPVVFNDAPEGRRPAASQNSVAASASSASTSSLQQLTIVISTPSSEPPPTSGTSPLEKPSMESEAFSSAQGLAKDARPDPRRPLEARSTRTRPMRDHHSPPTSSPNTPTAPFLLPNKRVDVSRVHGNSRRLEALEYGLERTSRGSCSFWIPKIAARREKE